MLRLLLVVCTLSLLFGMLAGTIHERHASAKLHCRPIAVKPTTNACSVTPDGRGMECHIDFLQPQAWGRCLQQTDETLLCQNENRISHYNQRSQKDWTLAVTDCPALAEQIKQQGQDPELATPPLIVLPERAPKGQRVNVRHKSAIHPGFPPFPLPSTEIAALRS